MSTTRPPGSGSIAASERSLAGQAGAPVPGPPAERLAYSVDEAACLTGLSRDLLYDEMRRGHLQYLKVGRRRLITREQLERFLGITPRFPPSALNGTTSDRKAATDAR